MYQTRTHRIDNRIVSISQPHVRPIVRGKAGAETKFGAKVAISMVDGYTFIDHLSWDSFNESGDLKRAVEDYSNAMVIIRKQPWQTNSIAAEETFFSAKSMGSG